MSRKVLFLLLGVCVFLTACSRSALHGVTDAAKTNTGEIVFELKYRGLSNAEKTPRISVFVGCHASTEAPSPFTKSLNLPKGKGMYLLQPLETRGENGEWWALELDKNKSVALYMDLDGDGKLSPNEKILPPSMEKSPMGEGLVTPDFKAKTKDGKEFLYRVLLVDNISRTDDGKVHHFLMAGSACLWEGTGVIDGKPFHLVLFDNGFDGQFTQFGEDSYALDPEAEYRQTLGNNRNLGSGRLSSLIPIGQRQQFYSLRVETIADGVQPARVVLKKSEIPLGKIALELKGTEGMKAEYTNVFLRRGNEIFCHLTYADVKEQELPIGSYQVENGSINYGSVKPDKWEANFQNGPEIAVVAGAPCILKLGEPKLVPTAVKEQDRSRSDAKPETVFKKGDDIYCSLEVKGAGGEKYAPFEQRLVGKANNRPVPQVRILDTKRKEVASASMPYG